MANGNGVAGPQYSFQLAVKVVWEDPKNLGADCARICRCDDSCEYAVKDGSKDPLLPYAEWFCTHLAELLGIASPACAILEFPDGSTAFGSRWEIGALPMAPPNTAPHWVQLLSSGAINIDDLKPAFSRIYAFDNFIHNHDRHANNFLFRSGLTRYAVLAMDYSRAWTHHGIPLPALPFDTSNSSERTVKGSVSWHHLWGII